MSFRNTPESRRETNGITYFLRDDVTVDDKVYTRLAVQTHFIERGESYIDVIQKYVKPIYQDGDVLSISEKIISMCQNNIVEKKDVKIGFWAKLLSRFASSNNHGVAMDEPYKLQLAINIAGLPRILWASFCSAFMKLFGKHGTFYEIAGHGIGGIDGFYEGSSFELYHDIALLNPKEPSVVCNKIQDELGINCMLVDANDLNVELFAKSYALSNVADENLAARIKDNPAGQSDELTPLILIREKEKFSDDDKKSNNAEID